MGSEIIFFSAFIVFILLILFIDLGLFSKTSHTISFRESLGWTALWVSVAIGFYVLLRNFGHLIHEPQSIEDIQYLIQRFHHHITVDGLTFDEALRTYNRNLSLEYLTGYIIEYSLSVDNVFVILMIFLSFGVDTTYYKKVLFWGILGAIIMRFIMIFAISALVYKFSWILMLFGLFLLVIAVKMMLDFLKKKKDEVDIEKHVVVRFMSRHFSVYPKYVGGKFWLREHGKLFFTPLFIVLLVIEFSDVIFAVDSVPAIFSVTHDPYIVFFSNVFAIIGLRSLFFLVSSIMNKFRFLKAGLAVLLAFVGSKMIFHFNLPTTMSLFIILGILAASILLSLMMPAREPQK